MKVTILDRVVLFVGAFFTALVGVALVLAGLQTGGIEVGSAGLSLRVQGWLIVLFGALLFAFGVFLLSLPAKYRKRKEDFVVQPTDSGELRISVKAIESLVQKVFHEHPEATLNRLDILTQRDGVVVDMGISLADNVSIPLLVGALQKQISQHLLAAAGVDVHEVRVAVEMTESQIAASPYLVQEVANVELPPREEAQPEEDPLPDRVEEVADMASLGHHQMPVEPLVPWKKGALEDSDIKEAEPDTTDPHEKRGQ